MTYVDRWVGWVGCFQKSRTAGRARPPEHMDPPACVTLKNMCPIRPICHLSAL